MVRDADANGCRQGLCLVDRIIDTGLEPVRPAEPLPPIAPEDIELLCWMGVERSDGAAANGNEETASH